MSSAYSYDEIFLMCLLGTYRVCENSSKADVCPISK